MGFPMLISSVKAVLDMCTEVFFRMGKKLLLSSLKLVVGKGRGSFRLKLKLSAEFITSILSPLLDIASLGLRGYWFMSLFRTILWSFTCMQRDDLLWNGLQD